MATTQAQAEQTERKLRPLYGESAAPLALKSLAFRKGTHRNGIYHLHCTWRSFYAPSVSSLHKKKPVVLVHVLL